MLLTLLLSYYVISYVATFALIWADRDLPVFYEDGMPRYIKFVEVQALAFIGPILLPFLIGPAYQDYKERKLYSNYFVGIM
jgi:hypothetical protein